MSRTIVAVDIGNSFAHLACFAAGEAVAAGLPTPLPSEVADGSCVLQLRDLDGSPLAGWGAEPRHWFVCSVHRGREQQLAEWVRRARPADTYRRVSNHDFPLAVNVAYPERVGGDRLAAAVAANRVRAPDHAAIIVDAGTAITVDLVDARGTFQGGAILPGLHMAARALAEQTDALPLVAAPRHAPPVLGKHTEAAIESGLFWGVVGAIRELVERLQQDCGTAADVLLTGGAAEAPAFLREVPGRFLPHLALSGTALTGLELLAREEVSP